jgi:hypothetical protein
MPLLALLSSFREARLPKLSALGCLCNVQIDIRHLSSHAASTTTTGVPIRTTTRLSVCASGANRVQGVPSLRPLAPGHTDSVR